MEKRTKSKIKSKLATVHPALPEIAHKGNALFTYLFERTGIPHGYSQSVAWFAERAVIAMLLVTTVAFSSGVLFTLYLSEPIGDSDLYGGIYNQARKTRENIVVYSQQVIDVASPLFFGLIEDNREENLAQAERLAKKEKLRAYLASYGSPFAESEETLDAFVNSKNMKLMVAISFVESTFGKRCYYYNCSGIGGTPPSLRKYDSYAAWIADFDDLLERRYKGLQPEEFLGLYVQPGSPNWLFGVKKVLAELETAEAA